MQTLTVKCKLVLSKEQREALDTTMRAFAAACNDAIAVGRRLNPRRTFASTASATATSEQGMVLQPTLPSVPLPEQQAFSKSKSASAVQYARQASTTTPASSPSEKPTGRSASPQYRDGFAFRLQLELIRSGFSAVGSQQAPWSGRRGKETTTSVSTLT